MIKYVIVVAVIAGVFAWWFAWDRDRAYNDPLNQAERSSQQLDAAVAGKPAPEFSQPWYEENPVLFGGAVGLGVFVIGTVLVTTMSTSQSNDQRTYEKPPVAS